MKSYIQIRSQFCICHSSWAVVICAILWPNLIITTEINAKWIFTIRFQLWVHNLCVEWFPTFLPNPPHLSFMLLDQRQPPNKIALVMACRLLSKVTLGLEQQTNKIYSPFWCCCFSNLPQMVKSNPWFKIRLQTQRLQSNKIHWRYETILLLSITEVKVKQSSLSTVIGVIVLYLIEIKLNAKQS